jgi:signal transduction histidine kinase
LSEAAARIRTAGDATAPAVQPRPPSIRLAGGEAPAGPERPVRTRAIFAQVVAGAAVVVLAVAVVGAMASRRVAERESVTDAAHTPDLLAEAVVQPALTDALLDGDPAAVARLDKAVRSHVLGRSLVRVKIWTAQGRIVYSDEARLIGQTFPVGAEERSVLAHPTTRAEVSDLRRPENRFEQGRGKLLEVYRPVWTPSGQPLLFETYSPYGTVTARTGELWRGFAGITMSSLLFLIALLLPILWRLLDRLRRSQAQREALLQRAVDASAEERRRIAGTLHDGVVQDLVAASFAVAGEAERAEAGGQGQLADRLHTATGTVRASIRSLRSLLVDIYPPSLSSAGLVAALTDLAEVLRARAVAVHLDISPGAISHLDDAAQRLVFRVAQECLRNAGRHAAASAVHVGLHRDGAATVLEVDDDGTGFEPAAVLAQPEGGHFGLRILSDLAADAGAVLLLASAPGAGCHWRLEIPDP